MWVTRDRQGFLVLFSFSKPERDEENGIWICSDNKCCEIPDKGFDEVKWENEPLEVTINQYGKLMHKAYRIWCKSRYSSGGFTDYDDEPTSMVYSTYETAFKNCPDATYTSWGDYNKYYIKECEIE